MKTVGFLLITLGTLVASWVAVLDEREVGWGRFGLAMAFAVAGVVLARAGSRSEARAGEKLSGDLASLEQSIERIVENVTRLDGEKEGISPYDLHGRIDELFVSDLVTFVDARESIAHVHGLPAYADVMNEFAAGERYLNRVWSASVDGYVDETREYLARARDQFTIARDKLRALGPAGR